ncbi:MAG: winged helix-turn-helix transcriptional regulator [Promethearchaeota archaeon]
MSEDVADECVILHALRIIGRKWMVFILSELLMIRKGLLFSELLKQVRGRYGEKISARMLTDSLNILEEQGIVERTIIQEKPIRVEYSLTEKGYDLEVVFGALKGWGVRWGDVKYKKCGSFTCIHNAVKAIDLDQAMKLLYTGG